jgi:subtilisin
MAIQNTNDDGGEDGIEVNVGYDGEDGKQAALDAAVDVVREFESLDVVTVRIPRARRAELEEHPEIRYVEKNGRSGA